LIVSNYSLSGAFALEGAPASGAKTGPVNGAEEEGPFGPLMGIIVAANLGAGGETRTPAD
jgi:hypothetical protein